MVIHSSILAREIPGQRSLAGYSPRGRKESDTSETTEHACMQVQRCPSPIRRSTRMEIKHLTALDQSLHFRPGSSPKSTAAH